MRLSVNCLQTLNITKHPLCKQERTKERLKKCLAGARVALTAPPACLSGRELHSRAAQQTSSIIFPRARDGGKMRLSTNAFSKLRPGQIGRKTAAPTGMQFPRNAHIPSSNIGNLPCAARRRLNSAQEGPRSITSGKYKSS